MPILILIKLLKNLIDDLAAMLVVYAALGQVGIHFVAIHSAISVPVKLSKLSPQTALFVRALLLLLCESVATHCRLTLCISLNKKNYVCASACAKSYCSRPLV